MKMRLSETGFILFGNPLMKGPIHERLQVLAVALVCLVDEAKPLNKVLIYRYQFSHIRW